MKLTKKCEGSYFSDVRGDFSHFISYVDRFETSTGGRMFSVLTWELGILMHLSSQMFLFWGEMPSFRVPWL